MNNNLILITGGSSGIGKAAAKELHKQGARIILQARNPEKLKAAVEEISQDGEMVSYYSTDLTDQHAVEASAKQIIANEGLPNVVINSAGSGEWLTFKEANPSHFKETMDSPYLATTLTCKIFYDKMQERGTGHFIIINSVGAYFSFPGATGYTPGRWAMLGLAKTLQADLYKSNFTVSTVILGKVDSPYFTNNPVSEERIPKIATLLNPTLSEESAGRIIARNVRTKRTTVIKPTTMAFFVFLNRLFPGVFRALMRI